MFNLARGLDVNCGCFSTGSEAPAMSAGWYLLRDDATRTLAAELSSAKAWLRFMAGLLREFPRFFVVDVLVGPVGQRHNLAHRLAELARVVE